MNKLLIVLLLMSVSVSMIHTASAHKSEVFGDYEVEVGWEKEPPLINVDNKITIKVTYAIPEERTEGTSPGKVSPADYGKGVTGLTSQMDVSVTVSGEKTLLTMVEDKTDPGQYYAEFTPRQDGFPIVHIFTTIDERLIDVDFHPERVEDGAIIETSTSDDTINASILATAPQPDRWMLIMLQFTDNDGNLVENVNYDIFAMQNGKEVLSKPNSHSKDGNAKHSTQILESADPADIQLKILGIGDPDDRENWTGPIGEVITVSVVPEFGPLHLIVLASVMGTSVLVMKSKARIFTSVSQA